MESLHAEGRRFDVVVIDPPAFIKRKKDIPKGEAAYSGSTSSPCSCWSSDGILVSCSCSYHLEPDHLLTAIQRGARHLGRFAQVVEVGGQSPDHPIHPAIPETRYLKAFFCRVVTRLDASHGQAVMRWHWYTRADNDLLPRDRSDHLLACGPLAGALVRAHVRASASPPPGGWRAVAPSQPGLDLDSRPTSTI